MANQDGNTYPFTFEAVREKAPSASGMYTIYTAERWIYVGDSDDIRQSLFGHLNEPGASMNQFGPLSFSFELEPAAERKARQQTLIAELKPACKPDRRPLTTAARSSRSACNQSSTSCPCSQRPAR
jgi:hypothetical protein